MDWEIFLEFCRNPHRGLDKELRGEPNTALILEVGTTQFGELLEKDQPSVWI